MPIRDETGADTDDDTLEERRDKLAHWPPAVTRILERRYADASAGGQEVSSLGLDEVLKVASSRRSMPA